MCVSVCRCMCVCVCVCVCVPVSVLWGLVIGGMTDWKQTGLQSPEYRRLVAEFILCFKIVTGWN